MQKIFEEWDKRIKIGRGEWPCDVCGKEYNNARDVSYGDGYYCGHYEFETQYTGMCWKCLEEQ